MERYIVHIGKRGGKDEMTHDKFNQIVDLRAKHIREVLKAKASEYATDSDRLHNFRIGAEINQCTELEFLLALVTKHFVAFRDFVKHDAQGQPIEYVQWEEKLGDVINYMILADALIREQKGIE